MIPYWRLGASLFLIVGLTACACTRAKAAASDPQLLGQFDDWAAYTYKAPDTKVCYVSSTPKTSEPKVPKRDHPFFLVSNFPGRGVHGEPSTLMGYDFKKETTAELKIDTAAFPLYPNGGAAWADTPQTEKKIIAAMKNGKQLTVKGTSWRGVSTLDTYSLQGLKSALAKIDEACK